MECPGRAAHGLRHLLCTPQCLHTQAHCLKLGAHLIKFVYASSCPNEIARHDFTGSHLSLPRVPPNICCELFLLCFELRTLAFQLALCTLQGAKVLSQTFCRRYSSAKQGFPPGHAQATIIDCGSIWMPSQEINYTKSPHIRRVALNTQLWHPLSHPNALCVQVCRSSSCQRV